MSAEQIQQIIRRSVIDRAFAKALRENFLEAIREYNLTAIEMTALRAMQVEFDVRKTVRHHAKHGNHRKTTHTHVR